MAALMFEVPIQTLRDRVKGRIDPLKNETTLLSFEEEQSLVEHVEVMVQPGYGITNNKLKELGAELAWSLGIQSNAKPLSNCWLTWFLQRWKERVSSVKQSALETNRAKLASPVVVNRNFKNLKKVIEENELSDELQFVYSYDETGIQPEHRPQT